MTYKNIVKAICDRCGFEEIADSADRLNATGWTSIKKYTISGSADKGYFHYCGVCIALLDKPKPGIVHAKRKNGRLLCDELVMGNGQDIEYCFATRDELLAINCDPCLTILYNNGYVRRNI